MEVFVGVDSLLLKSPCWEMEKGTTSPKLGGKEKK
jgi:hypothetical protein